MKVTQLSIQSEYHSATLQAKCKALEEENLHLMQQYQRVLHFLEQEQKNTDYWEKQSHDFQLQAIQLQELVESLRHHAHQLKKQDNNV